MDKELIEKATFSEVYRLLKNEPRSDIFECFKSLFNVALLFLPALMCQETAAITDIATGVTLAGAGVCTIVGSAAKNAFDFFKRKDHGDYVTRYEQMQIAQVLLVYASYFDTISQYLPNENGEILLSTNVKWKISQDGFETYLKKIEKLAQKEKSMPRLLTREFTLPNPTQKFSRYKEELKKFYDELNIEFRNFFEQCSFWKEIDKEQEELDREQKNIFWICCENCLIRL